MKQGIRTLGQKIKREGLCDSFLEEGGEGFNQALKIKKSPPAKTAGRLHQYINKSLPELYVKHGK